MGSSNKTFSCFKIQYVYLKKYAIYFDLIKAKIFYYRFHKKQKDFFNLKLKFKTFVMAQNANTLL